MMKLWIGLILVLSGFLMTVGILRRLLQNQEPEQEPEQAIDKRPKMLGFWTTPMEDLFQRAIRLLQKITDGRTRLYECPWFAILKTETETKKWSLPFSETFQSQTLDIPEMRFCFEEEAVLLEVELDLWNPIHEQHKPWFQWLALLKRYRPRLPLNGLIVSLSLHSFLTMNPSERESHALSLRRRFWQMQAALKMQLPVTFLITESEFCPGFQAFAHIIPEKNRQERMGWIAEGILFPFSISSVSQGWDHFCAQTTQVIHSAILEGQESLEAALWPANLSALKEPMMSYFQTLFEPKTLDTTLYLRGFFFTGDLGRSVDSQASLASLNDPIQSGKQALSISPLAFSNNSFVAQQVFLKDIFTQHLFQEKNLVQIRNPRFKMPSPWIHLYRMGVLFLGVMAIYGYYRLVDPLDRTAKDPIDTLKVLFKKNMDSFEKTLSFKDMNPMDAFYKTADFLVQVNNLNDGHLYLPCTWKDPFGEDGAKLYEGLLLRLFRLMRFYLINQFERAILSEEHDLLTLLEKSKAFLEISEKYNRMPFVETLDFCLFVQEATGYMWPKAMLYSNKKLGRWPAWDASFSASAASSEKYQKFMQNIAFYPINPLEFQDSIQKKVKEKLHAFYQKIWNLDTIFPNIQSFLKQESRFRNADAVLSFSEIEAFRNGILSLSQRLHHPDWMWLHASDFLHPVEKTWQEHWVQNTFFTTDFLQEMRHIKRNYWDAFIQKLLKITLSDRQPFFLFQEGKLVLSSGILLKQTFLNQFFIELRPLSFSSFAFPLERKMFHLCPPKGWVIRWDTAALSRLLQWLDQQEPTFSHWLLASTQNQLNSVMKAAQKRLDKELLEHLGSLQIMIPAQQEILYQEEDSYWTHTLPSLMALFQKCQKLGLRDIEKALSQALTYQLHSSMEQLDVSWKKCHWFEPQKPLSVSLEQSALAHVLDVQSPEGVSLYCAKQKKNVMDHGQKARILVKLASVLSHPTAIMTRFKNQWLPYLDLLNQEESSPEHGPLRRMQAWLTDSFWPLSLREVATKSCVPLGSPLLAQKQKGLWNAAVETAKQALKREHQDQLKPILHQFRMTLEGYFPFSLDHRAPNASIESVVSFCQAFEASGLLQSELTSPFIQKMRRMLPFLKALLPETFGLKNEPLQLRIDLQPGVIEDQGSCHLIDWSWRQGKSVVLRHQGPTQMTVSTQEPILLQAQLATGSPFTWNQPGHPWSCCTPKKMQALWHGPWALMRLRQFNQEKQGCLQWVLPMLDSRGSKQEAKVGLRLQWKNAQGIWESIPLFSD